MRHSHERWDGGGYPDGLAGDAIPLGSRIVSVCDAFDAMVSERPYRAARNFDGASIRRFVAVACSCGIPTKSG